jgi:hypothetical protein
MARLTLAHKIAAIALTLWKKGESFDAEKRLARIQTRNLVATNPKHFMGVRSILPWRHQTSPFLI